MTTAIKSVSLSLELAILAERYKISLSEAVRIGLSVILAEKGELQFLNRTNIGRKLEFFTSQVKELMDRLEGGKRENDNQGKINSKEAEEVFKS